MKTIRLTTNIRIQEPSVIIDLRGDINGEAEEAINAAFNQALQANPVAIILNFTDVDYINSTGIALIVGLLATARSKKVTILTCGLSNHYREIFHITRLSDFMQIVEDEAAANMAVTEIR